MSELRQRPLLLQAHLHRCRIEPLLQRKTSTGWVDLLFYDIDLAIDAMIDSSDSGEPRSIGYVGNIVTLWERLVEREVEVHLGSDQTSLHNPFQGGYFPADLDFEDATTMLSSNPEGFAELVRDSLIRHVEAVNTMVERGMYFWDYGNAFLLEAERAGASIKMNKKSIYLLI